MIFKEVCPVKNRKPNRLINEKSPYLLQHAYNPVDWYPWGEEAFARARREGKPVFLSIGYSTCHWCHVMERESFEDEEVARVLNDSFVCIKVDREERPDVDAVYMAVCQAMTGSGGWPLTVFLTPDREPFFAGTYFPKNSGYGRPGIMELAQQISHLWSDRRQELMHSAGKIVERLKDALEGIKTEKEPGKEILAKAYAQLSRSFDPIYG
ncbi:MAG TPA: thioredoxin domain-containing protein, partial [Firmicutes bacterium]|nr:thioredoxin domain-containing protein [Bacillota bacterium]